MAFLYLLESIRNPALDAFFSFITHAGEETLFIIVGLLFFWCVNKKEGYYLLCVGLLGTIVNQFLKLLFRVPRPWVRDPGFTIVESAREAATGYSFPSGHTQTSVGVYGAMARWSRNPLVRIPCVALCVLVPLSRMYLGVHTPADVGVSVLIALALIFGLYPLIRRSFDNPRVMRRILLAITGAALAYLAFVSLYPFPADTDAANLQSGVKSANQLLGCILGLLLSYEIDHRYIRFETAGPFAMQALKLILGLLPLLTIKAGLKAPLYALFGGSYFADCVRYFLIVAYAGCLWPLTFPHIARFCRSDA